MSEKHKPISDYSPEYLHAYNGDSLYAVSILFILLVTLCVTLRFYARRMGNVAWGLDDSLIIPGAIFCLALCTCALIDLSDKALGYHAVYIEATHPQKLIRRAKFILVAPLLYLNAVLYPKLAILATYLRIFTPSSYRKICWLLFVFLIANWFTFTVACFKMCTPLNYLWDRSVPGGKCFDINLFYRWSAFPNIASDVAMLILPLPVVWRLNTTRGVKVGLTVMFGAGGIGLFTSILRFAGYFLHNPISDNTWAGVYLYIYVVCESCMYLIAACLLTYKPLGRVFRKDGPLSVSGKKFRGLLGSWKSSSQRGGSKLSWRSSSMKKGSSSGGEGSDDDGVRLREVSTGSEGFSRPLVGVISTGGRDSDGDGKVSPV
ncbi:MAG: hypothetical protein L6R41_006521 [Letrouitia leprolyta]|nr:MAG: hypothetical protein L6R41_006521 [Letrouitia leprolyta]